MSLMDQLSEALAPHTRHVTDQVGGHLTSIEATLREISQKSDLARGDTGDTYSYLIRQSVLASGSIALGGPAQGEIWSVQNVVTNGKIIKSPAFAIRTNTGRLIFSAEAEKNEVQNIAGNAVLFPGEELVIESLGGTFDFVVTSILRKMPRQAPDAGWGVNEEVYEERARHEHEPERHSLNAQPHAPALRPDETGQHLENQLA